MKTAFFQEISTPFVSPGDTIEFNLRAVESLKSLNVWISGFEVDKCGKKVAKNEFFRLSKTWQPTQTSIALSLPAHLPPSLSSKKQGVEIYYQYFFDAEVSAGYPKKKSKEHRETFSQPLVVVSRAPESLPMIHSNTTTTATIMARSILEVQPGSIPVNIEFSVDKSFFFFGDTITLNFYVDNDTEETVRNIRLTLLQIWIFETPDKKNQQIPLNELVLTRGLPISPSKALKEVYQYTLPPPSADLPATARGGSLFRVEYSLQANLIFDNPKAVSPSARAPLLMYTIPNEGELDHAMGKKLYEHTNIFQKHHMLSFLKN